jgi:hypothetical protein
MRSQHQVYIQASSASAAAADAAAGFVQQQASAGVHPLPCNLLQVESSSKF